MGTVQFVTGKTAGAALFGSPVGSAHPLTGNNTIPVIAGFWTPVIRYATIGGITYTSTPRSGYNAAKDLATCLTPIEVVNFNCSNGTLHSGNYTHLVSYINGTQLASESSKTFAFDLDGTTQYLAYYFNGYNIADRLTISYVSGVTETILHDIVVGTDSSASNVTSTPKILDVSYQLDVVNISSFTYAAGDYLKIRVTSGYNAPANPNTNWDIKLKCLTTFDTTWAKPILDVCHPTLDAYDTNACRTKLSIPFAQYSTYYNNSNATAYTATDLGKYIIWQTNYTQGAFPPTYPVDVLNPRLDVYFNNQRSCSIQTVGNTGPNSVILSAGGYTITRSGTTGNVSYTFVFTEQADYDSYYNNYFTAMAALVPGYLPSNRTFTLPSNTLIDYYKYVHFNIKIANSPGDTIVNKSIDIHYGTFINFDNTTKTISFTLANITYAYTPPPLCDGSGGVAQNCGTLFVNEHTKANTVDGTYPVYSSTTYIINNSSVWGYNWILQQNTQTAIVPWVQDRILTPYWGSPYSVWSTSIAPAGFCNSTDFGGTNASLQLYKFFFRATITDTLDPQNNYKIESYLDVNGCYTPTSRLVYEIVSG